MYRGRLKNGKWRYGDLISADWYSDGETYILQLGQKCLVDPETVGQYTEIKVKNRKIFTGDVVKHHLGDDIGVVKFGAYRQPTDNIHTKHIGFYVDWILGSKKDLLRKDLGYWANIENMDYDYEIFIGNVHDNPELLVNKDR